MAALYNFSLKSHLSVTTVSGLRCTNKNM